MPPRFLIPISTPLAPRRYSTSSDTGSFSSTSSSSSSGFDDPFFDDFHSCSSSSSSKNGTNEGKEWGIVVDFIFEAPIAAFVLLSLIAWIIVGWSGLRTKIRARKAARRQRKGREAWERKQARSAAIATAARENSPGREVRKQESVRWWLWRGRQNERDPEKAAGEAHNETKKTRKPTSDSALPRLIRAHITRTWSSIVVRLGWKKAEDEDSNAGNEPAEKAPDIYQRPKQQSQNQKLLRLRCRKVILRAGTEVTVSARRISRPIPDLVLDNPKIFAVGRGLSRSMIRIRD